MAIQVDEVTTLLEVFDLPTSSRVYCDVLGFKLVAGDDTWWCMLELGKSTIMLNTAYEDHERPSTPDPGRARGHGDTSLYFSCPDPNAVYAHLREKGWKASDPEVTTYGMRQVSTKDPDGFRLFFQCPA
jgi:glyoxylase I family protein